MNRRSFFKLMGLGGVATAAAVSLPSLLMPKPTTYSTYILGDKAITLADLRAAKESLVKMEVKPRNGFVGWVHPYCIGDIHDAPIKFKYTLTAAPPPRGQRLRFIDVDAA